MLIFISTLVSVGFGYLFFRVVKPKPEIWSKPNFYARTFLAWSLFVSTSFYIQPFAMNPSIDNLTPWFSVAIPFGLIAIIAGYLYGKFR
jgi:hypothetical protein|tara:strand:+ start:1242 stop:1508 length:267 start_codon:yes stop_codon:yes gene_type:complete